MSSPLPSVYAQSLHDLSAQVVKGIRDAGLRKYLVPEKLIELQQALASSDDESLSLFMRDLIGESLSMGAGVSQKGGEAIQALSLAQAQCLIHRRKGLSPIDWRNTEKLLQLVQSHETALINWVETGKMRSSDNQSEDGPPDLDLIAKHFLITPESRQSAIGVFVASCAVMRCGLGFFTK